MDRNTIIGVSLLVLLFFVWQRISTPSAEEMAEYQRLQDSIALVEQQADSLAQPEVAEIVEVDSTTTIELSDSLKALQASSTFGVFATAANGAEEEIVLSNDLFNITFSNKGGKIKQVELSQYKKISEDKEGNQSTGPLLLLEDEKNKFNYFLPINDLASGGVNTEDLYFTATKSANSISFKALTTTGAYFEQIYTVQPGTYQIDYEVKFEGLNSIISQSADAIKLNWVNYLDKIEINTRYERNYTSIYYKPVDDDDPDHCSCTADDTENYDGKPIDWVSHSNQFFNTTFIAKESFKSADMTIEMLEEENPDLKKMTTDIQLPYAHSSSEQVAMTIYSGPNDFDRLYKLNSRVEDIIPFGTSIFGTINRWIIRPLFKFLSSYIGSAGIVILALTLIVKLLVYPLTYRMLYSQSKMSALKPRIEKMKEKFKDDQQKQSTETMKLYREFGVNPLGGCLPMLLQMPLWFALYRFFPAAIEFRQASFLWATDLSSYDVITRIPEIPLIGQFIGTHLSLFTVLWAVTTLIYTYYNTKHMDMSANPSMKYMQYFMPIMFLGFFNSFASGLTCYLLFSNLLNISQTLITKNFIIDNDKINEELEAYKKKPKKKGGFQERLEAALKEQQRLQEQKEKDTPKKKRRKK